MRGGSNKPVLSPKAKLIKQGVCRHFKGGKYRVIGVAKHSETLDEVVVYQSLKDNLIWVRPLAMFLETTEKNGKKIPRFKYQKP